MEIKSISEKIFRISSNKNENRTNHTNPFGVSFKGSIINADVFEEKNSNLKENQNKCKMYVSTLVGSINSVMKQRLNSVVSFGRRLKETTTELWDKATNITNINMTEFLTSRIPAYEYGSRRLNKLGVSELETMFRERLSTMEAA